MRLSIALVGVAFGLAGATPVRADDVFVMAPFYEVERAVGLGGFGWDDADAARLWAVDDDDDDDDGRVRRAVRQARDDDRRGAYRGWDDDDDDDGRGRRQVRSRQSRNDDDD